MHQSRTPRTATSQPNRLLRPWLQGVLIFLAAFVPRAMTAIAGLSHVDERKWLLRSERYARGYLSFDLPNATSVPSSVTKHLTMPGITTSVVGGFTRVIWGGLRDLGVASFPEESFRDSRSALIISQVLMAGATSGLLVLLWWVLSKWSTRVVATTAVLILAAEPYLVADGTKLKTDSFLMLFGAIGAFALAAALEVPSRTDRRLGRRRRWLLAVVAGIGVGGAIASKAAALTFGPFFLGLVVYAGIRALRKRGRLRDVIVATGLTLVVAIGLLAILWPALWADAAGQLELLRGTARLTSSSHAQYFLGEVTSDTSPLFYFVTVPFRMTPWLFLLVVPSVIVGLRVRAVRPFAVVALAYAIVPLLAITLSEKKFIRYAQPLWPVLAVLVGLLVQAIAIWCREQGPRRSHTFEITAAGAMVGLVAYSILVAPYGGTYANPALGGGPVAEQVSLIGGDDNSEAGAFIRDRDGARCAERRIMATARSPLWFRCGHVTSSVDGLRRGDYIVLFTNDTKRTPEEAVRALRALGRHVAELRIRGVDIAEIIQVT